MERKQLMTKRRNASIVSPQNGAFFFKYAFIYSLSYFRILNKRQNVGRWRSSFFCPKKERKRIFFHVLFVVFFSTCLKRERRETSTEIQRDKNFGIKLHFWKSKIRTYLNFHMSSYSLSFVFRFDFLQHGDW